MTKWTLRRWSCCCGPLRSGEPIVLRALDASVERGGDGPSRTGFPLREAPEWLHSLGPWSRSHGRSAVGRGRRIWSAFQGSAQLCGRGRPGMRERPTESAAARIGNAASPSGNVAARPLSDWRLARGRATATGVRAGRPVTRRQWNRRAANLCSALASRRLVSEPIVIRAAFGSCMRHHSRRGLALKSHRSSHVAPTERRGHVAVDARAARSGTPFRPRANTSRAAWFARNAMNENVVGIATVGVGAKNAATGRAATAKAPAMAVVGVRMSMQLPFAQPEAYGSYRRQRVCPAPIPKGIAGPVATRTPGHVGRRDPACSPAGAECSIRRATRRQTTWPDPENVWQRERTTIAQRTHGQGASKEEA